MPSLRPAAIAVVLVTAAAGGAAEPAGNPMLGDPAAAVEGRKVYRQRCAICHGKAGGRGPNLFATRLGDEAFLETVINGRKGATMPAFGLVLEPDQVWQVHAYVKSTDQYR